MTRGLFSKVVIPETGLYRLSERSDVIPETGLCRLSGIHFCSVQEREDGSRIIGVIRTDFRDDGEFGRGPR